MRVAPPNGVTGPDVGLLVTAPPRETVGQLREISVREPFRFQAGGQPARFDFSSLENRLKFLEMTHNGVLSLPAQRSISSSVTNFINVDRKKKGAGTVPSFAAGG